MKKSLRGFISKITIEENDFYEELIENRGKCLENLDLDSNITENDKQQVTKFFSALGRKLLSFLEKEGGPSFIIKFLTYNKEMLQNIYNLLDGGEDSNLLTKEEVRKLVKFCKKIKPKNDVSSAKKERFRTTINRRRNDKYNGLNNFATLCEFGFLGLTKKGCLSIVEKNHENLFHTDNPNKTSETEKFVNEKLLPIETFIDEEIKQIGNKGRTVEKTVSRIADKLIDLYYAGKVRDLSNILKHLKSHINEEITINEEDFKNLCAKLLSTLSIKLSKRGDIKTIEYLQNHISGKHSVFRERLNVDEDNFLGVSSSTRLYWKSIGYRLILRTHKAARCYERHEHLAKIHGKTLVSTLMFYNVNLFDPEKGQDEDDLGNGNEEEIVGDLPIENESDGEEIQAIADEDFDSHDGVEEVVLEEDEVVQQNEGGVQKPNAFARLINKDVVRINAGDLSQSPLLLAYNQETREMVLDRYEEILRGNKYFSKIDNIILFEVKAALKAAAKDEETGDDIDQTFGKVVPILVAKLIRQNVSSTSPKAQKYARKQLDELSGQLKSSSPELFARVKDRIVKFAFARQKAKTSVSHESAGLEECVKCIMAVDCPFADKIHTLNQLFGWFFAAKDYKSAEIIKQETAGFVVSEKSQGKGEETSHEEESDESARTFTEMEPKAATNNSVAESGKVLTSLSIFNKNSKTGLAWVKSLVTKDTIVSACKDTINKMTP